MSDIYGSVAALPKKGKRKKRRAPSSDGGCVVMPGSAADRYIEKAWREGRIVPMNEAARKNAKAIYDGMGIPMPSLPVGLRPGTKVGERKAPRKGL